MLEISIYKTINDSEFQEIIQQKRHPRFVLVFMAEWLGEGVIMDSYLTKLAETHVGKIAFFRVDIDKSPFTSSQFNISRLPSLYFFADNEVTDHCAGIISKKKLQALAEKLLAHEI